MNSNSDFLLILVVGCEVGFWIALFSGLVFRYLLKMKRTGAFLLASVPLIDLILLGATVFDLRNGAVATFAHGLAAAYIGFTVAFGKATIFWTDKWFAYKFAGGQAPEKPPSYGKGRLIYDLKLWGRCVLATAIMFILVGLAIWLVNEPARTDELYLWFKIPLGTLIFWFIFGPLWSLVFIWRKPKKKATTG